MGAFIRISRQKCYITADVSTYSIYEVNTLGLPANFNNALCTLSSYGFLPGEVAVPGMPVSPAPFYESNPRGQDTAQRIAFPANASSATHMHLKTT